MKTQSLKLLVAAGALSLAAPLMASEAEDMFRRMDINGDGKLTTTEHAQFCDTMFKQSDADQDGKLSVAESESAQSVHDEKVDKKAVVTHMRLVDSDGDGQISRSENSTYSKNGFTRADKNSDGVLDEDEFEAFHGAVKKELEKD